MKKILFVLSMAFLLLFSKNCNATEISSSFDRTFIGNYHYVSQNGRFGDFELFQRREDDRVAYCIEPNSSFTSSEYQGAYDLSNQELASKVGITESQLERISLIAYFGYGYQDHNTSQWIVATQAKIWETLGHSFQFTSRNSASNPWAYVIATPPEIQEKMDAIERLVQLYRSPLSIFNGSLTIPVGERATLNQRTLSFYQLAQDYPGVNLVNDTLYVEPKEPINTTVKLTQNWNLYQSSFVVYYHNYSQNLFLTGNIPNLETSFQYQALEGKAQIIKYDKDTRSCTSSIGKTMGNAIYGLYKSDGTLVQKVTVSNCMGMADHLTLGEYYWQEIEAPEGYLLDTQKYYFTITRENIMNTQTIQVYDEEDIKTISIHKEYLKENETLTPEEKVKFEIVNKDTNQVVATLITDKNGFASTTLRYGTYIIRQVSGTPGYHYIEPEEFVVDKNTQKEFTYSFVNKPILKNIKVLKKDNGLRNPILQSGIKFKLYDVVNQKYICRNEDCTFETNEYGELIIEGLYYSTYRLEEINQDLPGYLWNQEGLEFIINDDSPEEILLEFYNQPVQGEIIISKNDGNGSPLSDVVFQIFAKDDIYQNEVLLYHKGELVAEVTTNKDGKASLSGLPLGIYTVTEIRTQDGYQLDTRSYEVILEYLDNQTSIVYGNLELVNYKIPETKKNRFDVSFTMFLLGIGFYLYEKKYFCL